MNIVLNSYTVNSVKIHFDDKILKFVNQSILLKKLRKLALLFNYNKDVSVLLCSSFKLMKIKAHDYSMPNWVIGCNRKNKVFILNPKKYLRNDNTSIESLIVHEVVHVIINSSADHCPIWLNEGFAMWYADQIKQYDLSNKLFVNPFEMDYGEDIYYYSALITKKLFESYDEKLLIKRLFSTKNWINDKIFGLQALKELFKKG